MLSPFSFQRILAGLDTVQAAYYLLADRGATFNFEQLHVLKEAARANKSREGAAAVIGDHNFRVLPYGSASGYPLVLEHPDFKIECGEFNNPGFFVTYRSRALWSRGAAALHAGFISWAQSVGLRELRPEGLSRVDFTFDYLLPVIDFDDDGVVSLADKDSRWRENRKTQSLQFGKGDVVLRIYNKVVEILEKSGKVWFFELWGHEENIWRIEWQTRKEVLRRFGIQTFADLFGGAGLVLQYLANEHDSLRTPTPDSNRSRWPLHPLWEDLCRQIETFPTEGISREIDPAVLIERQLERLALQVYGYHKRAAALVGLRDNRERITLSEALSELRLRLERLYEPLSWTADVETKRRQSERG